MNRLKKISTLILTCAIITATFLIIESCQNDVPTKTKSQSSNSFQNSFNSSIDFVLHHDITTTQSRAVAIKSDDAITMYVAFPDDEISIKPTLSEIKTVADIIELVEDTGADYSFDPKDEYPDSISLSENEAKVALNPLVAESKKYLYSKGLSESDIKEMLAENNVDETTLVPFVLALIEYENNEQTISLANATPFPNLFALNANAMTVDWAKVGNCALQAIGIDFLFSVGSSNLKTWGIAAIKRAFKPIAQRLLGPIGALIAVGSFAYCLAS